MENLQIMTRWVGPFAGRQSVRSDLSWRLLCRSNAAAGPKRHEAGYERCRAGFGRQEGLRPARQNSAAQAVSNKTAAIAEASGVVICTCRVADRYHSLDEKMVLRGLGVRHKS